MIATFGERIWFITGSGMTTLLSSTDMPLTSYPLLHATELDQARDYVARVFCDHELDFVDSSRALDTRMYGVPLRYMTITSTTYGGGVNVSPGVLPGWYAVLIPIRGHSEVHYGDDEMLIGPGTAAICSPIKPLRMIWSPDCAQIVLRIEGSAIREVLSGKLGHPLDNDRDCYPEFSPMLPLHNNPIRTWRETIQTIIDDLDRGIDPGQQVELEQFLISRLLVSHSHNYTAKINSPQRYAGTAVVSKAIELMEDEPQRLWTVGHLAASVGVSARQLQAEFRAGDHVPPMRYLRLVRLRHVHHDLRKADPRRGDTVAEIALRWGFTHLSRFSADYRRCYGELPSEVLAR